MIPFSPMQRESDLSRAQMLDAVRRVLESGYWILGPEVDAFEAEWAARCGSTHAVGTGNGLDALEIALRALGVGPGDEVITTPMTALATVLAIARAGATPVLADIDPETALLDVASAERCLTPRTRAMIPVHLYGNGSAAPVWRTFADANGILLVEDCAQAHLATVGGRTVGTFGTVGAFSFYPTKNLGAVGDAGALVTSDADIATRARALRNYGQRDRYHHELLGLNSRLDEIQAAILRERLSLLDEQTQRRRDIADFYRRNIANPEVTPLGAPDEEASHVHHLFVVRVAARDELQRELARHDIASLIHYPVPAHEQPPFTSVHRDAHGLPHSEQHARTCLSLPCHPELEEAEIARVVEIVNSFGRR